MSHLRGAVRWLVQIGWPGLSVLEALSMEHEKETHSKESAHGGPSLLHLVDIPDSSSSEGKSAPTTKRLYKPPEEQTI